MTKRVSDFINAFRYRKDGARGQWRIISLPKPEGDCEDFALGVSWILAGEKWLPWLRMLFRGDFRIWTGDSTRGRRHAVLFVKGKGWIDNMAPEWMPHTEHSMERAYSPVYVLYRLMPHWVIPVLIAAGVAAIAVGVQ